MLISLERSYTVLDIFTLLYLDSFPNCTVVVKASLSYKVSQEGYRRKRED